MKIFNSKFVRVYRDKRIDNIVLINHMWRELEDIKKYGFSLYYQEVTAKDLKILESLKLSKSIEENTSILGMIDKYKLNRLEKYKFIIDDGEVQNKNIWFSQAGQYLYIYLKHRYKLMYPDRPSRVLLLPTMRCNGNCVFCITNSKVNNEMLEFSDDSWGKITKRVINELNPCNIDIVGGEPLLRSGAVLEIVKEIVGTNIVLKLITNGEKCNYNLIEELASYFRKINHNIQISFDGTEKTFNKLRPNVNYKKVVEFISNISKLGLNFGINMTITKLNYDEIDEVIEFIKEFNPIYITFGPLQVSVKSPEYCKNIMLNIDEETQLRYKVEKLKDKYNNIIFNYDKKEYPYILGEKPIGNKKELHTCTGFFEEMTILSDGHILPCLRATAYKEFYGSNILDCKRSLQDEWLYSPLATKFRTIKLKEPCKTCDYNQQCNQGCPLETYEIDNVFGGYDPHCLYKVKNYE